MRRHHAPRTVSHYHVLALLILAVLLPLDGSTGLQTRTPISKEEAISRAVNDIREIPEGYFLKHPRHEVEFSREGIAVRSRRKGIDWRWSLSSIRIGNRVLPDLGLRTNVPARTTDTQIDYRRGPMVERYIAKGKSIEQQFIIPSRPLVGGEDLVIEGRVVSDGRLRQDESGWQWRSKRGVARLGKVKVFDRRGAELIALMEVTDDSTRISIEWEGLETASYPVTVDPEIGANDFRISDMGPDGNTDFDAFNTSVAYNSASNEYLVVWQGDNDTAPLVDDESEIFGQRINAATGAEVGVNDFRISDMGPDGNTSYNASSPAVAYNLTNNEYLVVWQGDDSTTPLVDGEFEIFGQRLSATGVEVGTNDFRISDLGPNEDTNYGAFTPAVAWNSTNNEYLVVWQGNDDTLPLASNEYEIFGQRLAGADCTSVGTNDLRISDMGTDGDGAYTVLNPAVAYNSVNNEFLVVWEGEDDTAPLIDGEFEIFGQRIAAFTGAEIGVNDFRISDMGPDGDEDYDAFSPSVAYNSSNNEYLVVWVGDENTAPLVSEEFEVWGQRINGATGAQVGINDFRISDMGNDGDTNYSASQPSVAYNSNNNEYVVVWQADDNTAPLGNNEFEIFAQRLNATGAEIGSDDIRISDMGPDGNSLFGASAPVVVYNTTSQEYLVSWQGDDNSGAFVNDEIEIFGQRLSVAAIEIGTNDFLVSDMGPNGDANYAAFEPAVAYNSLNNRYLVVWSGDDNTLPLVDEEREIFGQLINASTGAEIGTNDFRISDMGPDGDPNYQALSPAVAYNSTNNEYLVVWYGDDNSSPLVNDELEIFGQRINALSGAEVGENDYRISDMGPNGNTAYAAINPAVVYSPNNNEYLVVWQGDDDTSPLVNDEFEIFGQRLAGATGIESGTNDFRISDMGTDGSASFDAENPALAFNSTNNEYLVVWQGDDNVTIVDNELEIFGQRLNAVTGAEVGSNDFRISDMGPDGNVTYGAANAAAAYNSVNNEYLVVWQGDDNSGSLVDEEFEIYGQRLNASDGSELGTNDFRVSDMGPDGNASFDAFEPAVSHNPTVNEYLVVWQGDDNTAPQVDDEREIFYQRINASNGDSIGNNDFRISDMGPDGNTSFNAIRPAVVYSATNKEYLVVWEGRDAADDGDDIFGQRIDGDGNRPPLIGDFGTLTASVGNPFAFVVPATDSDVPAQTLTFSVVGAPSGLQIDSSTGLMTWTPGVGQVGPAVFSVFVHDNGSPQKFSSKSVTVNVILVRFASSMRITEVSPNVGLSQVVVTARLTDASNGVGLGARTVTFSPGGATAETAASGLVTVPITLAGAGPHTIGASFAGDAAYQGSSDSTTIIQGESGGCSYALLKTGQSFPAAGGTDSVQVSTSQGSCAWNATSNNPSMATITAGSNGVGTGTVSYSVAQNLGPARSGTLTLAGLTFTVNQVSGCSAISLSPGSLPDGAIGVAYSQQLTGLGGTGPYDFTVSSGGLPNGLNLSSSGLLSGTPTIDSTFNFTIKATDANGCFGETAYSLIVTAIPAYEGDVAPRPNGSGTVVVSDWVQVGRFSVGLDTASAGAEFQKADCAPRNALGDGQITVADWVQAGRYSVGLDPPTLVGGSSTPPGSFQGSLSDGRIGSSSNDRLTIVKAGAADFNRGALGVVDVEVEAYGDENAIAFTLEFDVEKAAFLDASLPDELKGGTLLVNALRRVDGRIGIALSLRTGTTLAPGKHKLLSLSFIPAGGQESAEMNVEFRDSVISRQAASSDGVDLSGIIFLNSKITIEGEALSVVSGASFAQGPVARDSIAAAFGKGLADVTQVNTAETLPVELSGTFVRINDSSGRELQAPLFFVSPYQTNFLIPADCATGIATVTVIRGGQIAGQGIIAISDVSPGLFSVGGVAAAQVCYLGVNGEMNYESIVRYDDVSGSWIPVALDVSGANDVYLVLYGTGLRNLESPQGVRVRIGGLELTPQYFGAHQTTGGLDQINILLPKQLSGRGDVRIEVDVDGVGANVVASRFK